MIPRRHALPLCAALAAVVLQSCSCDSAIQLQKGLPPGYKQDILPQVAVSKLDLLWIIDNSGSMANKQDNLANNLAEFMGWLAAAKVDYRIAVGTTDVFSMAGELSADIITPQTSDPQSAFATAVHVGTQGKALEEGLAAAEDILSADRAGTLTVKGGNKVQFMRDDAFLFIVVVSDEEDNSFGEPRYYWRTFEEEKGIGNDGRVFFSSIAGGQWSDAMGEVVPASCTANGGATEADRYYEVAKLTGGLFGSICDDSFASTLHEFGRLAVGLQRKFPLSSKPDLTACSDVSTLPACLQVSVKYRCDAPAQTIGVCTKMKNDCANLASDAYGQECIPPYGGQDGWAYEPTLNAVSFAGRSIPGLGSEVVAVYKEAK